MGPSELGQGTGVNTIALRELELGWRRMNQGQCGRPWPKGSDLLSCPPRRPKWIDNLLSAPYFNLRRVLGTCLTPTKLLAPPPSKYWSESAANPPNPPASRCLSDCSGTEPWKPEATSLPPTQLRLFGRAHTTSPMGNSKSGALSKEILEELQLNTKFTEEELCTWYQSFLKECPSGRITRQQFQSIYAKFFPDSDPKAYAEHVFRSFDANSDGTLDFKEYVIALHMTTVGKPSQKLEWAFSLYDVDGNGAISKNEVLEIVMVSLYAPPPLPCARLESPRVRAPCCCCWCPGGHSCGQGWRVEWGLCDSMALRPL